MWVHLSKNQCSHKRQPQFHFVDLSIMSLILVYCIMLVSLILLHTVCQIKEDYLKKNLFFGGGGFGFLPIHRCNLALYSQYFPESCEKKDHRHITRVIIKEAFSFLWLTVLTSICFLSLGWSG